MPFKQKGYEAGEGTGKRSEARQEKRTERKAERGERKSERITARGERKSDRLTARADKLKGKASDVKAKSTVKAVKASPTKTVGKKIEVKAKAPISRAKPLTTAKTVKKVATKRGTGKTYKSAWEGMSAEKKAKFTGGYSEFKGEAVAHNSRKDSTGVMKSKPKSTGPKNK